MQHPKPTHEQSLTKDMRSSHLLFRPRLRVILRQHPARRFSCLLMVRTRIRPMCQADTSRRSLQAGTFRICRNRLPRAVCRIQNVLPVDVRPAILFNPLLKSTWYMVPALAVILVTMITALLTGFSIVKEKESGTLEQLLVTPVSPIHIVIGK